MVSAVVGWIWLRTTEVNLPAVILFKHWKPRDSPAKWNGGTVPWKLKRSGPMRTVHWKRLALPLDTDKKCPKTKKWAML
jgi:hypothetical protein